MEFFQISLIVVVVFIIIEIYTLSFVFLGFAFGMASVAMLQFLTGTFALGRDVIVFSIGSLFFIFVSNFFRVANKNSTVKDDDVSRY
jgi:membrane protein implicated in regulation of membrane protease activity